MKKMIELALFDSVIDVRFNLLRDMLEQAGIDYLTTNEKSRTVKPLLSRGAGNIAIGIKVYEEDLEAAQQILESIQ
jgi:hypothetical protein